MMNSRILFLIIFFLITGVTVNVSAHVAIDNPQGGENFREGNVVTIQWHVLIYHGSSNWDLLFSSDGGVTWDSIANNLSESQLTFDWTIPNVQTNSGQIKVVQDNDVGVDYDAVSGNFTINGTTGIGENGININTFKLYDAYPNPFNPSTTIAYSLQESGIVKLSIYNCIGQKVIDAVNSYKDAGNYKIKFNAEHFSSGIYYYKIESGSFTSVKKMILLK